MTLQITINMDNSAFEYNGNEAHEILSKFSSNLHSSQLEAGDDFELFDSNGNNVGKAEVFAGNVRTDEMLAILKKYHETSPHIRRTAEWHSPWYLRLTAVLENV